ncbi:MAG: NAD(P)H-binding protein [Bacteroidales bacterium]|nr:NAD(P)H-binding protein [Bacteroidales bacterium]
MAKLLITGASGNIGHEIVRELKEIGARHEIIAADYNVEKSKTVLGKYDGLTYRHLDYGNANSFKHALKDVDVVFLLRPPQLANIPKYFAPFVAEMKTRALAKVVFLSVQGVDNNK